MSTEYEMNRLKQGDTYNIILRNLVDSGYDQSIAPQLADLYLNIYIKDPLIMEFLENPNNVKVNSLKMISDNIDLISRLEKNHKDKLDLFCTMLGSGLCGSIDRFDSIYLKIRRKVFIEKQLKFLSEKRREHTNELEFDNLDWNLYSLCEGFWVVEFTSDIKQRNFMRKIMREFILRNTPHEGLNLEIPQKLSDFKIAEDPLHEYDFEKENWIIIVFILAVISILLS